MNWNICASEESADYFYFEFYFSPYGLTSQMDKKLSPAFAPLYLSYRQVAIRVVCYVRKIGIMDFAELISVSKNRTFWLINKFSRITMKTETTNMLLDWWIKPFHSLIPTFNKNLLAKLGEKSPLPLLDPALQTVKLCYVPLRNSAEIFALDPYLCLDFGTHHD